MAPRVFEEPYSSQKCNIEPHMLAFIKFSFSIRGENKASPAMYQRSFRDLLHPAIVMHLT